MKLFSYICLSGLALVAVSSAALAGKSILAQTGKSEATSSQEGSRVADVKSRDAIVAALYDSISGPAGERDWERFRSLFIPEAQLIAAYKAKDGKLTYKAMT